VYSSYFEVEQPFPHNSAKVGTDSEPNEHQAFDIHECRSRGAFEWWICIEDFGSTVAYDQGVC
jgi:hypothetical protein